MWSVDVPNVTMTIDEELHRKIVATELEGLFATSPAVVGPNN